jgi:hypothetical protein
MLEVITHTPNPILLHATTAINVNSGVIAAGISAGSANDTRLLGVTILKNGGPATLTIAGFRGEDGTARNIVLTGSTSVDTQYTFSGIRNTGGPMTLTASVADVILFSVVN